MATPKFSNSPNKITSLFREEAVHYRLYRHLGSLILYRPLSLKIISPVIFLMLIALGGFTTQLKLKRKVIAELNSNENGMQVVLSTDHARLFVVGESYISRHTDDLQTELRVKIEAVTPIPCPNARDEYCHVLHITPDQPLKPGSIMLWSNPQPFFEGF